VSSHFLPRFPYAIVLGRIWSAGAEPRARVEHAGEGLLDLLGKIFTPGEGGVIDETMSILKMNYLVYG